MPNVWISHAHEDRPFVQRLLEDLRREGVDARSELYDVVPGASLGAEVTRRISEADAVLVVLSSNAAKSAWVAVETALAMGQQEKRPELTIIPILADRGTQLPVLLRDRVFVDMSNAETYRSNFDLLLRALYSDTGTNASSTAAQMELLSAKRRLLEADVAAHEETRWRARVILVSSIGALATILGILSAVILFRNSHTWTAGLITEFLGATMVATVVSLLSTILQIRRNRHSTRTDQQTAREESANNGY